MRDTGCGAGQRSPGNWAAGDSLIPHYQLAWLVVGRDIPIATPVFTLGGQGAPRPPRKWAGRGDPSFRTWPPGLFSVASRPFRRASFRARERGSSQTAQTLGRPRMTFPWEPVGRGGREGAGCPYLHACLRGWWRGSLSGGHFWGGCGATSQLAPGSLECVDGWGFIIVAPCAQVPFLGSLQIVKG